MPVATCRKTGAWTACATSATGAGSAGDCGLSPQPATNTKHAPSAAIEDHLGRSEPLRALVTTRPGLRVPGTVDAAETAFRTLIGQQISLAAAATGAAKLAAAYGEAVELPDPALTRLFPAPAALAAVDPETLPMPRSRGRTAPST